MAGLLDLIAARTPEESRQTLADLVRGPQNRLRGLLDSPVGFLTDALNDVVPTGQQAAEQLQRYQLPMSQDYAMGPSGYDNKLKDMALAGLTVYHGSPHKFDKFDMNKIGTGEGAQAYGHGLYMAESPEVAAQYAGMGRLKNAAVRRDGNGFSVSVERRIDEPGKMTKVGTFKTQKEVDDFLDSWNKNNQHTYKVDLPDEHIAKMLDWDKPLSQQSKEVQKAVKQISEKFGIKPEDYSMPVNWPDGRKTLTDDGSTFYRALVRAIGGGDGVGISNSAAASDNFAAAGIPGIRYLDGGSRGAGSGTSNYVVFDDSLLKILERNGMPVP